VERRWMPAGCDSYRGHAVRTQERLDAAKAMTFEQCAEAYVKAHRRNAKHAAQWEATLATYAEPIIGALPVQAVSDRVALDGKARNRVTAAGANRGYP
jgi:hypothetical protein